MPCFQTEKFCSHYGCPINEEYVLFNRTSFINPEIPFPKRKSVIINEKCIRPLAEVKNESAIAITNQDLSRIYPEYLIFFIYILLVKCSSFYFDVLHTMCCSL